MGWVVVRVQRQKSASWPQETREESKRVPGSRRQRGRKTESARLDLALFFLTSLNGDDSCYDTTDAVRF